MRPGLIAVLLLVSFSLSPPALGADESVTTGPAALYLKAQVENTPPISKLKPGDTVQGKLLLDVYSREREVLPAGSMIRLTVDKLVRRRRVPNDHWPWVIKLFTPRHENSPTFESATATTTDGKKLALRVHLLAMGEQREVRASAKKPQPEQRKAQSPQSVVSLEALEIGSSPGNEAHGETSLAFPTSLPEITVGTSAKLILLAPVSASGSQTGDVFQARLVEPVRVASEIVLPEGTVFEGKVLKRTPPRMLSRPGSVLMTFTQVSLPGGASVPIAASLNSAELDQRSHTKIDPEGKLRGDRPGKLWMVANIGATAGIAKAADDGTQLVIEAIVSTATDASTAGTARIVATCGSVLFLLTRHGRDVVLPKFTEVDIVFDRPVTLRRSGAATPTP